MTNLQLPKCCLGNRDIGITERVAQFSFSPPWIWTRDPLHVKQMGYCYTISLPYAILWFRLLEGVVIDNISTAVHVLACSGPYPECLFIFCLCVCPGKNVPGQNANTTHRIGSIFVTQIALAYHKATHHFHEDIYVRPSVRPSVTPQKAGFG